MTMVDRASLRAAAIGSAAVLVAACAASQPPVPAEPLLPGFFLVRLRVHARDRRLLGRFVRRIEKQTMTGARALPSDRRMYEHGSPASTAEPRSGGRDDDRGRAPRLRAGACQRGADPSEP